MRLNHTLRLLLNAVLLVLAVGLVWWAIGYHLGRGILEEMGEGSVWRRAFGFREEGFIRLFALAFAVPVTLAILHSVEPRARWVALAATAAGAVLLYADHSGGAMLGVVLLVFAVAGVSETEGPAQILSALAAALVVSFVFTLEEPFGASEKLVAVLVRAVFFFAPLILGPFYIERYALERVLGRG